MSPCKAFLPGCRARESRCCACDVQEMAWKVIGDHGGPGGAGKAATFRREKQAGVGKPAKNGAGCRECEFFSHVRLKSGFILRNRLVRCSEWGSQAGGPLPMWEGSRGHFKSVGRTELKKKEQSQGNLRILDSGDRARSRSPLRLLWNCSAGQHHLGLIQLLCCLLGLLSGDPGKGWGSDREVDALSYLKGPEAPGQLLLSAADDSLFLPGRNWRAVSSSHPK